MSRRTRRSMTHCPTPLSVSRAMNTLLEGAYWPQTLEANRMYHRRHDDTDGKRDPSQDLQVAIRPDGDVVVATGYGEFLRFRTWAGGGLSLRTRNALLVLAEAIRRDTEERPQAPHELPKEEDTPL